MIDSGSDEHCIPKWFAPRCSLRKSKRSLCDVQDNKIEVFGEKTLIVGMESADDDRDSSDTVDFTCDFVCGNTAQAVFSFVKLMRANFGFEVKNQKMLFDLQGQKARS